MRAITRHAARAAVVSPTMSSTDARLSHCPAFGSVAVLPRNRCNVRDVSFANQSGTCPSSGPIS